MATYNFTVYPDAKRPWRITKLTGQQFGKLLVFGFAGINKTHPMWHCWCECGNGVTVVATNLIRRKTTSCGCYRTEFVQRLKTRDLTGRRFGRWTVLERVKGPWWICLCVCGTIRAVRRGSLVKGTSTSCGCRRAEVTAKRNHIHGASYTSEYWAFRNARQRCTDPTDSRYYRYGGRGIQFRFNSFTEFYKEMGAKPSPYHSLNRVDNDGHYEKGNLQWATATEQARNRASNITLTLKDVTKIIMEWSESVDIPYGTLLRRHAVGWCDTCALTIPVKSGTCIHRSITESGTLLPIGMSNVL